MCSALVSRHGFKNDVYFIVARLFRIMAAQEIFSVARELTSGESDRLLPGRTVSIGSDRVRLPTSSTPLFPVNLLLPVPLIKRLAPISGSGRNRTQSACWWRQPDSGRVYWTCVQIGIIAKWNDAKSVFHRRFHGRRCFWIVRSLLAGLYDPLGWASLYIIRAKIMLQCTWSHGLDWDDQLPADMCLEWTKWQGEMAALKSFTVPRYVYSFPGQTWFRQLVIFCDASEDACAAAVYMRATSTKSETVCHLLRANMRLMLLKTIYIPRRELIGCQLAVRLKIWACMTSSISQSLPQGAVGFLGSLETFVRLFPTEWLRC